MALEETKGHKRLSELTPSPGMNSTQLAAWAREGVANLTQLFDEKTGARDKRSAKGPI